jgi:hypothetical protein
MLNFLQYIIVCESYTWLLVLNIEHTHIQMGKEFHNVENEIPIILWRMTYCIIKCTHFLSVLSVCAVYFACDIGMLVCNSEIEVIYWN